jgi:polysaccharide biosynthesis protein PslG
MAGFAATAWSAPDATLTLANAPGTLIVAQPGSLPLRFAVDVPPGADDATVTIEVRGRDRDGVALDAPVATYRAPARPDLRIDVTLPRFGWFEVDARLHRAGAVLAEDRFGAAAVPPAAASLPDAGVSTHFALQRSDPARVMPLIRRAGFSWLRDELYWDQIEREPGVFAFPAAYDRYLDEAVRVGLKPLIVLDYGNAVAYPGLFAGPQGFPRTVEERALFTRYAARMTARYADRVKHWEIWNEPSIGPIRIEDYAALLTSVSAAIKQRDPDAQVLACGGGGAGGGPGGDCAEPLLKQLPGGVFDGVSIHPYMTPFDPDAGYPTPGAWIPAVSIPTVWPRLRDKMVRASATRARSPGLWVTELGWPSRAAKTSLSDATQAAYLLRSFLLSRRYGSVVATFWYDFVDDGVDPANAEHHFGLLRANLTPKPAYVAATVLANALGARAWTRTLREADGVRIYQYGEPDDAVFVGWRAGAARTEPVRVEVPAGRYRLSDWQGATRELVVPAGGFAWPLGPMPQYLIPASRGKG